MNIDFSAETITLPKYSYLTKGSFGIFDGNYFEWETCRDRFFNKTHTAKYLLFCCNNPELVIDFVKTIESIINLSEEQELRFKYTNQSKIIFLEMSEWWRYHVRRSLLSAFLRCGDCYKIKSADSKDNHH